MAAFYHVLPDALDTRAVAWVLRQAEYVEAHAQRELELHILSTEVGVGRAVARALGADVPPLEARARVEEQWEKPEWMRRFEEANRKRR